MLTDCSFEWDGNADTANKMFGEAYGIDWEYLEGSPDIKTPMFHRLQVGDKIKLSSLMRTSNELISQIESAELSGNWSDVARASEQFSKLARM